MAVVITGAEAAAALKAEIAEDMKALGGYRPHVVVVRTGAREDYIAYEQGIEGICLEMGMRFTSRVVPWEVSNEDYIKTFREINEDPDVDGVILIRPLPEQIDEKAVACAIDASKDLDGMSPENLARVFMGDKDAFAPCTAEAVMYALAHTGVDLKGKKAAVIGRSLVVGKPLACLLTGKDATVTLCHSKTADLAEACRNADILVPAAGCKGLVTKDHIAEGAIVIDVAFNDDGNGGFCGDVEGEEAIEKTSFFMDPFQLGYVTTIVLVSHLSRAARIHKGIPRE